MGDESVGASRKMKFKPKVPPRRVLKSSEVKIEPTKSEADDSEWQKLVKAQDGFGRKGPKAERKSQPVQVAFGNSTVRTSGRSYVVPKWPSTAVNTNNQNGSSAYEIQATEKEYVEPWDYYSYYPTTLPLRRPYSGNPELLDEEEFGPTSTNLDYNEDRVNSAAELGLMQEETEEEQILLFHLPEYLPLTKRSASAKGKEVAEDVQPSESALTVERGCEGEDLPAGIMGKLQVYNSGALKLKLGDVLYEVSPGLQNTFAQEVAVVNPNDKAFCVLGEISRQAVLVVNEDSLLEGFSNF